MCFLILIRVYFIVVLICGFLMTYDIITDFIRKISLPPPDPTWKFQKEGYPFSSQVPALREENGDNRAFRCVFSGSYPA